MKKPTKRMRGRPAGVGNRPKVVVRDRQITEAEKQNAIHDWLQDRVQELGKAIEMLTDRQTVIRMLLVDVPRVPVPAFMPPMVAEKRERKPGKVTPDRQTALEALRIAYPSGMKGVDVLRVTGLRSTGRLSQLKAMGLVRHESPLWFWIPPEGTDVTGSDTSGSAEAEAAQAFQDAHGGPVQDPEVARSDTIEVVDTSQDPAVSWLVDVKGGVRPASSTPFQGYGWRMGPVGGSEG